MKCNTIQERFEELELTKREYALAGAVLFLLGVVVGMLCSPRKNKMFGCNSGYIHCLIGLNLNLPCITMFERGNRFTVTILRHTLNRTVFVKIIFIPFAVRIE